jgi:hypothetical protein
MTESAGKPPRIDWADEFDWASEVGEGPTAAIEKPIEQPAPAGSVDLHRETTRSELARRLMGLLTITVLTIFLLAGLQLAGILGTAQISIRELAQIVLTPVVTLTGTALGFYYGAQSTGTTEPNQPAAPANGLPSAREPGKLRKAAQWLW